MLPHRHRLFVTAVLSWVSACAGLNSVHTLTLSSADIDRPLQRGFPVEQQVPAVLDVVLRTPQVSLLPETPPRGAAE